MEAPDRGEHSQEGRLKRLYDRLASILKRRGPERTEAFFDYAEDVEREEKGDGPKPDEETTKGD